MTSSVPAIRLEVVGRVQGVGFRWFVREHARRGDLAGWVRNRPDGSVEIEVAGDEEGVARLLQAVRTGPPGAVVEGIREQPVDPGARLPHPFGILK